MKKKSIGHLPMFRGTASLWLYAAILALFAAASCTQPGGNEPVITIQSQPDDTTVTEGSISGSLSVTAAVTEDAELAYQWYGNTSASAEGGAVIEGATAASFTIPTALKEGTYYYFCEITAPGAASVRSTAAKVTVGKVPPVPLITITTQPAPETKVNVGSISGSLSVTASGINGATVTGYQWYSNTAANNEGGKAIEGETKASFAIPTDLAVGEHYYFCEVTGTGGEESARSNVAKVTVGPRPVISVTDHPAPNTEVTEGSISGSLSVNATVTENAVLSYQWYSNSSASSEGGTSIDGATDKSFTIPTTLTVDEYFYFCRITAPGAVPVRSNAATVRVLSAGPAIRISVQPTANTTVKAGEITGSLSLTAGGTGGAIISGYQWYSNSTASYEDAAKKIEGETKTSFGIPTDLPPGEYFYFCEITATGVDNPVRSRIAKVTVINLEIGIVIELNEEQELVEQTAEAIAFEDKLFTAESGWTAYQWYVNGIEEAGAESANYTFNKPAGLYTLTVVVTNGAGDRYSGSCLVAATEGKRK